MIMDKLCQRANERAPICVGLDTKIEYLPEYILKKPKSAAEKILEFNKRVIDATHDVCACFKVQVAYYEALGIEGMIAYAMTLQYIRKLGALSIGDIKRGDIAATGTMYAKAHFEGDFEADFITVNAYMGLDAVSPYFEYVEDGSKGMFILLKTSNASSEDFQDLAVDGEPLYCRVADKINAWGAPYVQSCGFSAIGAVVGLTHPKEIAQLRARMPHTFFLIPGYGAQGGTGRDLAELFQEGICGVVNASRAILTAHQKITENEDFTDFIRQATIAMKEDITQWL